MTGKRFTHKEDDWEILDNGEHLAYAHSDYQAEKICELLNELDEDFDDALNTISKIQEENQSLQEEIKDYNDVLARLEEQNEELKKENK